MKLSSETINVLKNFASINPNIVIRQGSEIKTISEAKNILATAKVPENFPQEFGVYDLNAFLSVIGMFEDPDLSFSDDGKFVSVVGEGNQSVKYFFSDTSILTTPQKDVTMPPTEVVLSITEAQMNQLRRASSALGVSDVVIKNAGSGSVDVMVTDIKDSTSNSFDLRLDNVTCPDEDFSLVFNIANFKLIPGDFKISISSKLISQFETENVTYWVALEKTSKFGA